MGYVKQVRDEQPEIYMLYKFPALEKLDFGDVDYVQSANNYELGRNGVFTCITIEACDLEDAISDGWFKNHGVAKEAFQAKNRCEAEGYHEAPKGVDVSRDTKIVGEKVRVIEVAKPAVGSFKRGRGRPRKVEVVEVGAGKSDEPST